MSLPRHNHAHDSHLPVALLATLSAEQATGVRQYKPTEQEVSERRAAHRAYEDAQALKDSA